MPSPTLIRPPPADTSKSAMENVLELITLRDIGPDIFTNARELWHPPGARGVYGGAVIAQCLAAAQHTVPPPSPANDNAVFLIHSMHCYFVLAGDSTIPILYHVERVREGRSFVTRTVQARQRGKCIFTTTLSFMREGSGGEITVDHGWDMPEGVREGLEQILQEEDDAKDKESASNGVEAEGPFVSKRLGIINNSSPYPHHRKPQAWIQCRGAISPSGGQHAHLSALAYMSDSWFIGTVSRAHHLMRENHTLYNRTFPQHQDSPSSKRQTESEARKSSKNTFETPKRSIGMMVSLDHTIYFHRPREVKADEWMCTEMETPWSGEGRGLVMQRIWNKEGRLLATCVQEGLVRLQQEDPLPKSKL
ncbi:hypothetical protein HO173_008892 [Letharia columbiana]|uniref:Uncharacterized protein n=1 Tax=Letharia columbiana TaxID=112416 RepID=A0A8H6L2B2_9LECA|nr:uncharacterized protein HO173_008892 [Letharia columbiana]KAF6232929.1 hypothetical protein HO173_008892 [Letharia columbiana]